MAHVPRHHLIVCRLRQRQMKRAILFDCHVSLLDAKTLPRQDGLDRVEITPCAALGSEPADRRFDDETRVHQFVLQLPAVLDDCRERRANVLDGGDTDVIAAAQACLDQSPHL